MIFVELAVTVLVQAYTMLKVCSPVVVPIVSWSKQCPLHEITEILFSPKFSEIVTGGSGGELIIWTLDNKKKVRKQFSNLASFGRSGCALVTWVS